MNVTIQDTATLRAIRPADVAAYLRSRAWKQTEVIRDEAIVWSKPDRKNSEYEILLLLDTTMSEYARRMAEVMETLEVAEQRSQIDILHDIEATTTDVVRIRLQHGLIENGTIPLEYAVRMVEQARELMLASACAAVRPRALYAARKPQEALDYLRGLRMGPTEQGSFVISVQSPVAPRLQQTIPLKAEETRDEAPFERRVMLTLVEALAATHRATTFAIASSAFEPFTNAVPFGVSANLCAALSALGMDNTAEEITIGVSWAPSRPIAASDRAQFRFGRDTFPLLHEAARLLRESSPVEDYRLYGSVTQLRRDEDAETGRITMTSWSASGPRNVSMTLDGSTYAIAVKAHTDRESVYAVGELVKEGRTYTLRNVREFSIVDIPDTVLEETDLFVPTPQMNNILNGEDPFADE